MNRPTNGDELVAEAGRRADIRASLPRLRGPRPRWYDAAPMVSAPLPSTMKAVVKVAATGGREGTEVREVPVPEPGAGEVLLEVVATAICGTDRHIYNWDPSIHRAVVPPRVYGHEFCGKVRRLGSDLARRDLALGDYVSCEMHVVCGDCFQCRTGQGHICKNTRILGLHGDGCFAQYVKVPASNVIRLDASLPPKIGAFLDALGNAVHTTQVVDLSGRSVAVLGYGPIGAMCASIAEVSGASLIYITDVSPHALGVADAWRERRKLGNVRTVNVAKVAEAELLERVRAETGGGVDVVLELSGAESAINLGLEMAKNGGILSLLGLPKGHELTIQNYTKNVIFKGLTLKGIIGRQMYSTWYKMLDLLRAGLDVDYVVSREMEGLDGFHEALELLNGNQALKVVFYPNGKP